MKRVKRNIITRPNPLFESWLKEWQDEARRNGSESQYCFGRALKSLKKYPLRLETGKECFILENFGSKLCTMLDKKLKDYNTARQATGTGTVTEQYFARKLRECSESTEIAVTDEVSSSEKDDIMNTSEEKNYSKSETLRIEEVTKRKHCMDSPEKSSQCSKGKSKTKYEKKTKKYLPSYRSGSYAILLTLYKTQKQMSKGELEIEAQELCDASFKRSASSGSYYTAWSSMASLLKKGLVEKNGRPARFSLTPKGTELVLELQSSSVTELNKKSELISNAKNSEHPCSIGEKYSDSDSNSCTPVNSHENLEENHMEICCKEQVKIIRNNNSEPTAGDKKIKEKCKSNDKNTGVRENYHENEDMFILLPNEFDVILYVDTKEMESKQNVENDKIVKYLKRKNINFEVKFLNVGDYLWVCRDRRSGKELVLPYIVERKRMDDLASSIRDGRFHEQKFRLKNCGIQNCIYLVEKYGHDSLRLGLPLPTIQQAMSNTKVVDGFNLKLTNNNDESLNYLSLMTNFFTRIFQNKTLVSCSKKNLPPYNMSDDLISLMAFADFNKDSGKMRKFTVRNMLVKQLLQFSGLSVEKAKAIVKIYPTPKFLMNALQSPNGESSITKITCGALNRSIGSTIAKALHQLYTSPTLT